MKRKILIVILSMVALLSCAIALSACNYETQHKHSFKNYTSNNDWTCTLDGTKTAKCDGCDETDTVTDTGSAKHTPKAAVKENNVPPTYEAEGSYDSVVRCEICDTVISSEHITVDKLTLKGTEIYSKSLTVDGDTIRGSFPNNTQIFRFAGDITVADGATYYLCTDILGLQVIPTKIAPLEVGDNTFYLVVVNGDPMTYTVTLRVRPIYTVSFDSNGGENVDSLTLEEDSMIDKPAVSKTGYTTNWTANGAIVAFPYKITEDVTLIASYTANEYTATLDVNGGNSLPQTEYPIYYDSDFTFVTPTRTGYTFSGWYDSEQQVTDMTWKYSENKTFIAKWSINSYALSVNKNIANARLTENPNEVCDFNSTVSVTAQSYLGYDWLGWYKEEELLSSEQAYTFAMPAYDLKITAKWKISDKMENFNFTSSLTECIITSVIDNTITEITIPNGVTSIGDFAFYDCTSLTSITIPEGVTSIGGHAFYGCSSLTSITIPEGVTSIGGSAFHGCSSLTSITIPEGVTSIGLIAFYACESLSSVIFEKTENWYIEGEEIFGLSDSSTAAEYLTDTYVSCSWNQNKKS